MAERERRKEQALEDRNEGSRECVWLRERDAEGQSV